MTHGQLRSAARSVGAIAFGLLLVSSLVVGGIAPSPVGGAAASHDCSDLEHTMRFLSAGEFIVDVNDHCAENHVDDVREIEDNKTELDLYSSAIQAGQNSESAVTIRQNYLQDTRTVAYSKGQAAAAEAMNAGKTEAEVITAGREAVRDYYAMKEINTVRVWETQTMSLLALAKRANNESGIADDFISIDPDDSGKWDFDDNISNGGDPVISANLELVNGTELKFETIYYGSGPNFVIPTDENISNLPKLSSVSIYPKTYGFNVQQVDTAHPSTDVVETEAYNQTIHQIRNQQMMVADNVELWADRTYDDFQNGNLSLSNYVNPVTKAQEYSQQFNETGYYSYAVSSLAMANLSTPDLNSTGHMVISTGSGQFTGLLMSQTNPPSGTWTVGTTYNAGALDGEQFIVTQNGTQHTINGDFTITEMADPDGQSITSTQAQNYNYQAVSVEEYKQLQENITKLRNQMEAREPGPSVPPGESSGSIPPWALGAGGVTALIAIVAVATRD
jgi:hypothetical protein